MGVVFCVLVVSCGRFVFGVVLVLCCCWWCLVFAMVWVSCRFCYVVVCCISVGFAAGVVVVAAFAGSL